LPGVAKTIEKLAPTISIHVITADTFGLAKTQLADLPVELTVTPANSQADAKRQSVLRLGADSVVAIGNGRNDRLMLAAAALSIAVIQKEGVASEALASAHVVSTSITDAFGLLTNPKRLVATLRS
jgi:soluble P-type ATPase